MTPDTAVIIRLHQTFDRATRATALLRIELTFSDPQHIALIIRTLRLVHSRLMFRWDGSRGEACDLYLRDHRYS
jgi:hypothetical protein